MKAFAIVGYSDSGKTRLIERLIPELKRRGKSVAVVKHCSHGFSLTPEEKDSWRFVESGSDSVAMVGPDRFALLQKDITNPDLCTIAARYFNHADIVLVEGGSKDEHLEKIAMLRKGFGEEVTCSVEELLAVVSDFEVSMDESITVFHPDQIVEIADLLESSGENRGARVHLEIDGASVRLKDFVQNVFANAVSGMVAALKGVTRDPARITLSIVNEKTKER
jgi:molybdopterin-guanine dinucleotide biosynthesis protein B